MKKKPQPSELTPSVTFGLPGRIYWAEATYSKVGSCVKFHLVIKPMAQA